MTTVNYTVNQFALVDEKSEALTQLLTDFSWQDEPLLKLSLPLFSQIQAIQCIEDLATLDAFRFNLIERLKTLKKQGRLLDISPQILDKLSFMWAAFFDERVIYESSIDTTQWENNTLVSQLFGIRNSGETFFTLIKQLMEQPSKHLALLQLAYLLLQLGFKGRYHDRRAIELNQFIADINHALSEFGILSRPNLTYSAYSAEVHKPYRWLLKRGLSPKWFWLICFITCLVATILYQQNLSELYKSQQQEYREMGDETDAYLKAIKPKTPYVENTQFISQGLFNVTNAADNTSVENVLEQQESAEQLDSDKTTAPQSENTVGYFVQLGVYDSRDAAKYLLERCQNTKYPLQIEQNKKQTFVGYKVTGFTQAKTVSNFFFEHCQLVPYIKEQN